MKHVVLLGDSIFDNRDYVPGELPVIEQLEMLLPVPWQATLLAVDGHVTANVIGQTGNLRADASHLVVSCSGNDVLQFRSLLADGPDSVAEVLERLTQAREDFQSDYREMLAHVLSFELPIGARPLWTHSGNTCPYGQRVLGPPIAGEAHQGIIPGSHPFSHL